MKREIMRILTGSSSRPCRLHYLVTADIVSNNINGLKERGKRGSLTA
jgi:hypothetical protein